MAKVYAVDLNWKVVGGKKSLDGVLEPDQCRFIGSNQDCKDFVRDNKPNEKPPVPYDYDSNEGDVSTDENNGTNEPAAKSAAEIFNSPSANEKPPVPNKTSRVYGERKPDQRGGWFLFINPVDSKKSVVTESSKNRLLQQKAPLKFLGACDEKGNLLTDGK